jgi:hypothetical protein
LAWTRNPVQDGKKEFAFAVVTRSFKKPERKNERFGIAVIVTPFYSALRMRDGFPI